MINEIATIVGKENRADLIVGHKLIEGQLEYVFEEDGKLFRTSIPLTRGGSVLVITLPADVEIVGIDCGQIVIGYKPEATPA